MEKDAYTYPEHNESSLLDFAFIVAENARLLVVVPLLAGLVAYGAAFLIPDNFTATTRIGIAPQARASANTFIGLINGRTIGDRLIDRFDLLGAYNEAYREDARRRLAKQTKAYAGRDGLITLHVHDRDPLRAAKLANAYVEELSRLRSGMVMTVAQERRAFLENQLRQAQQNLRQAQLALEQTESGRKLLRSAQQAMVERARLEAQIAAQERTLSTMLSSKGEASAGYESVLKQLDSLYERRSRIDPRQPHGGATEKDVKNFEDLKYHETLVRLTSQQYESARLQEAREAPILWLADAAVPPERASGPRRWVYALTTTFLAGFVLLIFVFARESFRKARRDPVTASKIERIKSSLRRKKSRENS